MKKQMKMRLSAPKNRMVFRLWAFMMIPVMFGIGFMWVVQIFLFEQNYANAGVNEALNRLSPVMEDLRTRDIGEDEKLLSFISHIGGELLLVSEDGTLIKMYSSGHLVQPQEWERKLNDPKMTIQNTDFRELLALFSRLRMTWLIFRASTSKKNGREDCTSAAEADDLRSEVSSVTSSVSVMPCSAAACL